MVFRITRSYMEVAKQTQVLTIGQTPRVAFWTSVAPQESVRRSKPIPSLFVTYCQGQRQPSLCSATTKGPPSSPAGSDP